MNPLVSAAICTHNPRPEFLGRVLEGLRAQTLPAEQWELLLIDNRSKEPLAGAVDLSWHPHARHVREEELGLTAARLCGVRNSTAGIIIFVDDDTVLAPDYLENAVNVAREWPFVGVWGGSVIPSYEKPLPAWVGSEVWRLTVLDVEQDVWSNLREGFETKPVGAGLCLRREVGERFAAVCAERKGQVVTDRAGAELTGYGDMEICQCAIDLGFGAGRSTKLKLTHLVPESRLTLDYFVRHAQGDASSLMLFRASRGLPISRPHSMSPLFKVRWYFHRVFHRIPREQFEIQKAHHRGLEAGYELACKHFAVRAPAAAS